MELNVSRLETRCSAQLLRKSHLMQDVLEAGCAAQRTEPVHHADRAHQRIALLEAALEASCAVWPSVERRTTRLDYPAAELPAFTARRDVPDGMAAVTQEPWGTAYALRNAFAPRVSWRAKTGTLREREWTGSLLLFAGAGEETCAAPAAGVVTIEFEAGVNPDGAATALFRDAVVPLLRDVLGWGKAGCLGGPLRVSVISARVSIGPSPVSRRIAPGAR